VRGRFEQDLKKYGKNFPIFLCKLLKQNHRAAKFTYSCFLKVAQKFGRIASFAPPKAQGSRMPLVRAVYHDLLRRVAARLKQGRNDGGQGARLPGHQITLRAPKNPNNVTRTSVQYICFRKTSGLNRGTPNLLLASGAI